MTLTIHWSKCESPHIEIHEGVTTVQISDAGLYYGFKGHGLRRVRDFDLADSWVVKS